MTSLGASLSKGVGGEGVTFRRVARGGSITIVAQAANFLINFGSTILLARLVSPREFGLYGMVLTVAGFAMVFKDAGLTAAAVQRTDISHKQASALFWLNLLVSLLIGCALLAASPLVASFYGQSQLMPLTALLSVQFVMFGLSAQHRAILQREMRFGNLAKAEVLSLLLGTLIGVYAALHGYGAWSLVFISVGSSSTLMLLLLGYTRWVPSPVLRVEGLRSLLGFGVNLTGFNLLNYFARNLDKVLIGRFMGADILGHYGRAYMLLLLPISALNQPLTKVLLPALSRVRGMPDDYERIYSKSMAAVAWITMPSAALMSIWGGPVVTFLLGDEWRVAGDVFEILALAALVQPMANLTGVLFLSVDRTAAMMRWGVASTLISVACLLVGLQYGLEGIAWGEVVSSWLRFPMVVVFACIGTPVRVRNLFRWILPPLVVSGSLALIGRLLG